MHRHIRYMYQPHMKTWLNFNLAAGWVSRQPCSFGDSCNQPLNLRRLLGLDLLSRSCT